MLSDRDSRYDPGRPSGTAPFPDSNPEIFSMNITVNGETRAIDAGATLQQLLDTLDVNCDALVVQRNDDIIARDDFATTALAEGDALELVRFVGGG